MLPAPRSKRSTRPETEEPQEMSDRQGRLAAIEDHLGVTAGPCPICLHETGVRGCMAASEAAELTASLDQAIRGLVNRHSDLIQEVEELRNQ